jgi:hypothetical protein
MKTFHDLKSALNIQFDVIKEKDLFVSKADKNELKETYLSSFPEGTNPIFVTNTEHDCNCCMQYIRSVGNVLAIVDGKLVSVWDIDIGGHYQVVADAMSALVKSKGINGLFLHHESDAGQAVTHSLTDGVSKTWDHFHQKLPSRCVSYIDDMPSKLSKVNNNYNTLKRAFSELKIDSVVVVQDLIAQNSLYRGEEQKAVVDVFATFKRLYDSADNKELFLWETVIKFKHLSSFRNSAIGTLVTDLSDGMPLEKAVKSFEDKVAPANYKRPKSLVTASMIKKAETKVVELGIADSLQRRYAKINDIIINNVLFADRTAKASMGVFDELLSDVTEKLPNLDKVEEVSINTFLTNILPKSKSIEVFFGNELKPSLVSLIAPVNKEAPSILKWGNNFTWSYNGEMTDSVKERVKKAGGNVTGDLRCSLSWFNADDLDLHVIEPDNNVIYFQKKHSFKTGGTLDVDMNAGAKTNNTNPVENITWADKSKLTEDREYQVVVHNYCKRNTQNIGFSVELEFEGKVSTFNYSLPLDNRKKITVVSFTYSKTKGIQIIDSIPNATVPEKIWNISTEKFHKVKVMMQSPNHWDGEETGNKHYFFMLDSCANSADTRGFYNEFLNQELHEHRKVFEVLSSKMKVKHSDEQLSGLGFSSTQKNSLLCRVEGSFNRLIKIKF